MHVSHIPISDVPRQHPRTILGGIDEVNYRKLGAADLKTQWEAASRAAGRKFILAPGCTVPNDSTKSELSRLPQLLGA